MRYKKIFIIMLLIIITILWLTPMYLMVKISVSPPDEVLTQHPTLLIHSTTFKHWKKLLSSPNILIPLKKSFSVALLTSLISLIIAVPASYVLSRLPLNIGYYIIIAIFFTRMVPEVGVALPISINFIRLGLFDKDIGLVMAHLIRVLPIVTWILMGTFKSIPKSLEEAAYIDGSGKISTLIRIILPLARPGIVVGIIFAWILSWEEFIYASYLCLANKTLPLEVFYYINRGGWFESSTYATIITIPMLVITYYLQRYIVSGYLSGAVKG